MKRSYFVLALIFVLTPWGGQAKSNQATPVDIVRNATEQALSIIEDSSLNKNEKKERTRNLVLPLFDTEEISKRVLGQYWKNYENRREEFIEVFTEFLWRKYTEKLNLLKGAKVQYYKERISDGKAEVEIKAKNAKGGEYELTFRMHRAGEEWKIYDVLVDGRSMVNHFRLEVGRYILNRSFDELLDKLKEGNLELPSPPINGR